MSTINSLVDEVREQRSTMTFRVFNSKLQDHFKIMCQTGLFTVDIDKDEVFDTYLNAFPQAEQQEHTCNTCKSFLRKFAGVVTIADNKMVTLWDFEVNDPVFQSVLNDLSSYIKTRHVSSVYLTNQSTIGVLNNRDLNDDDVIIWHHFFVKIPTKYRVTDVGRSVSKANSKRDVLYNGLTAITSQAIEATLELISTNSLHRGGNWKTTLIKYLDILNEFNNLETQQEKDLFVWFTSSKVNETIATLKNSSIGVFLLAISEGQDINAAKRMYENSVVGAHTYQTTTAAPKVSQIKQAEETVKELGLDQSLLRRYATKADIEPTDVLWAGANTWKADSIFDDIISETTVKPKKYKNVEEVSAEDFVNNVLPAAKELRVLVENKHVGNFVTLTDAVNDDSPLLFGWDNRKAWTYHNNLADSDITDNVRKHGGRVDGVLRTSLQWNKHTRNTCDLDLHMVEPSGNRIDFTTNYTSTGRIHRSSGRLDVDVVHPVGDAVENIVYTDLGKMPDGKYSVIVHVYSKHQGKGFQLEIVFGDNVYRYNYDNVCHRSEKIAIATITKNGNGFSVESHIPVESTTSSYSQTVWGTKTNTFVPVGVVSYSPNHWGENASGHKQLMLFLKDCIADEELKGFFNEQVSNDLREHRKTLQVVSDKLTMAHSDEQLSGLGFSFTKRNTVLVEVTGATKRVIRVKF